MKVAGYVRVSTQEQVEGFSIGEQSERLQKYCEARGWTLAKIYTDPGYSGAKLERPAIQELIRECKQYECILVYKLDRLSRSQKDTLYLIEDVFKASGVAFVSIQENFDTSTPFGMAMIGILAVFAQLEREQIKERMTMGMIGRAKAGKYIPRNNDPIGYHYTNGRLELIPEEAEQVAEVFRLHLGGMSARAISIYMHERYTNRYGSWARHMTVMNVLSNPVYAGKIKHAGQIYDSDHEPIISWDTFQEAQRLRENHAHRNITRQRNLLAGLVWCSCGNRMRVHSSTPKDRKRKAIVTYTYYICEHCHAKAIKKDRIDGPVVEQIMSLTLEAVKMPKPKDNTKKIAQINTQIDRAMNLYLLDGIDLDQVKEKVEKLVKRRDALMIPENTPKRAAEAVIPRLADIFAGDDFDAQKAAVNALIDRIDVVDGNIEIHWNL